MQKLTTIEIVGGFTVENLSATVTTLMHALNTVIEELAKEKADADGSWFDALEKTLIREAKSTITEGISVEVEAPALKLGIDVLQAVLNASRYSLGFADQD